QMHILMLSMYDSELSMIRLLNSGVKGFLKKNADPMELKAAIESVVETGFYYSKYVSNRLVNLIRSNQSGEPRLQKLTLSETEITFIKLCATELSYKEIAKQMQLSPRAIEQLRTDICDKLEVQTRVGIAMIATRHGFIF
ncbi:MAG: response regulator transcription factor, partial [Chitinophagaceae bacterium]